MPYTINHEPSDYICKCGAIVKAPCMQKQLQSRTLNHEPSDYICKCGAIVKAPYMQKHLLTAKHQRDVVGCENIEVVALYKYGND